MYWKYFNPHHTLDITTLSKNSNVFTSFSKKYYIKKKNSVMGINWSKNYVYFLNYPRFMTFCFGFYNKCHL